MYYGNVSTASNRADWQDTCILTDEDTGDFIDLTACRITMTVALARRNPNYLGIGEGIGYDYGAVPVGALLTGSTDTGEITVIAPGTFQWAFPYTRMNCLRQGEYLIGIRISQNGQTAQLIAGTVTVFEGIDMQ